MIVPVSTTYILFPTYPEELLSHQLGCIPWTNLHRKEEGDWKENWNCLPVILVPYLDLVCHELTTLHTPPSQLDYPLPVPVLQCVFSTPPLAYHHGPTPSSCWTGPCVPVRSSTLPTAVPSFPATVPTYFLHHLIHYFPACYYLPTGEGCSVPATIPPVLYALPPCSATTNLWWFFYKTMDPNPAHGSFWFTTLPITVIPTPNRSLSL